MELIPHERSLVQRLEGKPFVLLGVNFDASKEELKKVEEKLNVNWRSWWNGRGGKIGDVYNVRSFPTILVLDAKGVIRHKGLFLQQLDVAVEKLLKDMP